MLLTALPIAADAEPFFAVVPAYEQLWGQQWPTGQVVTIHVGPELDPAYTNTATADEWGGWQLNDLDFDFQPGQTVTVSSASMPTQKVHIVTGLRVTNINVDDDTISGEAAPYATVQAYIEDEYQVQRNLVADGSGSWTADFSEPVGTNGWDLAYDIQFGLDGCVEELDDDDDRTFVVWRVPLPFFRVDPSWDDIDMWGHDWPAGTNVNIKIWADAALVFETNVVVEPWTGWSFQGYAHDVVPGNTITVSDGATTLSNYVVTPLAVTNIDLAADTVSGTAETGTAVCVSFYRVGDQQLETIVGRHVVTDENGRWFADFTALEAPDTNGWGQVLDLGTGMQGEAMQTLNSDIPHGSTSVRININTPHFRVDPQEDDLHLWGHDWPVDATVSVRIYTTNDLVNPVFEATNITVEPWGDWDLWSDAYTEIKAGDHITVSDGTTTISDYVVPPLAVTNIDLVANTVSGIADPFSDVAVEVYRLEGVIGDDDEGVGRQVQADANGHWLANFSVAVEGDEYGWGRTLDLDLGLDGGALQEPEDRREPYGSTYVHFDVRRPFFQVNPRSDALWGQDWPANQELTIEIGPDYTNSIFTDSNGWWWMDGHDEFEGNFIKIQVGMQIRVTCGDVVKEHTVQDLGWFPVPDIDTETVSGTAPTGIYVVVRIQDQWHISREAETGTNGNWVVDFSTAEDEEETFDIGTNTQGTATIEDEDGDGTLIPWTSETVDDELNAGWYRGQELGENEMFFFEIELFGSGIHAARIQTPSNVWHDLTLDDWWGAQWQFEVGVESLMEIDRDFPDGTYQVEITRADGVTTNAFDFSGVQWPSSGPQIVGPAHAAVNVSTPDAWLSWEEPVDPNFDFIYLEITDIHDEDAYEEEVDLPPSTTSFLMTDLGTYTDYEISLLFVNLSERETNGIPYEAFRVRFTESYFSTGAESAPGAAAGPQWWYDREVLATEAAVTNDYAAANAGQLKHLASQARDAMAATIGLDTAAGTNINTMVSSFSNSVNYAAVNIGQAKHVAEPFYDRLLETGRVYQYPWTGAATTNDHALINIGQLKNLFDFDL